MDTRFQQISANELWVWSLMLAAVAYCAEIISGSHAANPLATGAIAGSIFSAGAFNIAAWLMILGRAGRLLPERAASFGFSITALALGFLCVIPMGPPLAVALALLGSMLLLQPGLTRSGSQAGLLLLGLAGTWGSPFVRFIHVAAAKLDAQAVGWIINLTGGNVIVLGNTIGNQSFSIEVLTACASSAPLPGIVLAYLVVAFYLRGEVQKNDLPWLAASLLTSIVLTEIRLSLMVPDWADWNWWHNGPGVAIYELAALAGAVLFPVIAVLRTPAVKTMPHGNELPV